MFTAGNFNTPINYTEKVLAIMTQEIPNYKLSWVDSNFLLKLETKVVEELEDIASDLTFGGNKDAVHNIFIQLCTALFFIGRKPMEDGDNGLYKYFWLRKHIANMREDIYNGIRRIILGIAPRINNFNLPNFDPMVLENIPMEFTLDNMIIYLPTNYFTQPIKLVYLVGQFCVPMEDLCDYTVILSDNKKLEFKIRANSIPEDANVYGNSFNYVKYMVNRIAEVPTFSKEFELSLQPIINRLEDVIKKNNMPLFKELEIRTTFQHIIANMYINATPEENAHEQIVELDANIDDILTRLIN